jgi:glycosyltransferase involved in cell wall biosynthesis
MASILVHVTTVPETFNFFRGQIGYLKEQGFEVHAVSSRGSLLEDVAVREEIPIHSVEMTRRITPHRDLIALQKFYRLFSFLKPDIVHGHTPKGGLLGVLGARMAGVPVVVYSIHGLPFTTASGMKRHILCWSEMAACFFADRVFAVSRANLKEALAQGFCQKEKLQVLGNGSCNGVDAEERFNPQKLDLETQEKVKNFYQINRDSLVVGYVGRIVRDKGIAELEESWQSLRQKYSSIYLLFIGPEEMQNPVPKRCMERLKADPKVIFTGSVENPIPFYAVMDILVLPTYREGFPIVPLEAAAMELPVVSTSVDGCVEAVIDGVTGILVPPRDSQALAEAIEKLINKSDLRKKMGRAGREMVLRDFQPKVIWQALYNNYIELCAAKKCWR